VELFTSVQLQAYSFGLRHAVDADHIAAIDNVIKDYDKIEVHCH
jgi:high-affinity nickel permease